MCCSSLTLPSPSQVPAGKDCQLKVEGLKPNEVYTFAVAAYTRDGQLIGGNIGDTSLPHLAAHPLPLLAGFAHLSKVHTYVHIHFSLFNNKTPYYVCKCSSVS